MRVGEILSLCERDIDMDNQCIHITKTTTLDKNGKVILGAVPKTKRGKRDIYITEIVKPILEKAIKIKNPSKEGYLFCKPDGSLYTDSALNSCFKRICEKAGIKGRVHNHKMRKNFNTRGIEYGVDMKVLEDNAGHSDIHILMDIYTEVQKDFAKRELQKYTDSVKLELGNLVYLNN